MGLSNYVPNSRISQAGVCTSTTRPASPYEGQMIYETDTNRVLIWDNAAWVMIADTDQPPGLQLVDTEVFTTSSSFDMSLPSDYDNFRLLFKTSATSTTVEIRLQFLSGTTVANTNYNWYIFGGVNIENGAAQSSFKVGGTFSTAQECSFSMDIIDATKALRSEIFGHIWGSTTAGGLLVGGLVGVHATATAYDGIRITTSTGNMTGEAKLYGYRN